MHPHNVVPYLTLYHVDVPAAHGFGDVELGVNYRFVHETEDGPQVRIFPVPEVSTGNPGKGLGNGRA